jgi:hypothetical protein
LPEPVRKLYHFYTNLPLPARKLYHFYSTSSVSRATIALFDGKRSMAERAYKPSERVPSSGVYRVDHNGHREMHEATLLEGELFPACSLCEDKVRFTLKYRAANISQDKDFPRR